MIKPLDEGEVQAGVEFFERYSNEMGALLSLLDPGRSMTRMDRAKAAEIYASLKNRLKQDYKRLAGKESKQGLTHIEGAFLLPAVRQASARLRPATNSNPVKTNWHSALYSAKIDVDYFLHQLKE